MEIGEVESMKDSHGNNILIGDKVKFLWNFDNKIHTGDIIKINDHLITIQSNGNLMMDSCYPAKITTSNYSKLTIMPRRPGENIRK